ncbi:MAG: TraR/DksA C4-type zinc finger protein [Azovibrio sp.]
MDIVDIASDRETIHRELALAAQRAATASRVSYSHCLECGDEIPEARRQAVNGVRLCIVCQGKKEHKSRVHL